MTSDVVFSKAMVPIVITFVEVVNAFPFNTALLVDIVHEPY